MESILLPGFALAAVTFFVWCRLPFERLGQMKRARIHPQAVATSAQMAARLQDTRAADNLRNLFELPVLFYFALLAAAQTGQGGGLLLGLAWAFVALRALHSLIHCGYNRVQHRFVVYVLGAACLWALLAALALRLLRLA
ncbi:MAG: MAPEG family protein [Aquimonas sp.]|nr:MAPEG family protein [Aquimonas sp.]